MTDPGWYQDPASPSMLRWWDGRGWTNDVRPGWIGPGAGAGFDPAAEVAEETKAGRRAAKALVVGAAVHSLQVLLYAVVFGRMLRDIRRSLDNQLQGNTTTMTFGSRFTALFPLAQLAGVALLVVEILFAIWFYKAATVAARAGLPARRSPGWAIGGFLVPIVNFWFPYQSALDFFPPDHPGRRKVPRWWILYLAMTYSFLAVLLGAVISTGVALAVSVISVVLAVAAAWAARELIDEVDRVHADVVGRLRQ